jgi:hypothetical protein
MNLLIGKGSNSGALVKEYYEKQTILDVLDNYDASVTESRVNHLIIQSIGK